MKLELKGQNECTLTNGSGKEALKVKVRVVREAWVHLDLEIATSRASGHHACVPVGASTTYSIVHVCLLALKTFSDATSSEVPLGSQQARGT